MLSVTDLRVRSSSGENDIVVGVTLSVPTGEVHAVMGPNGAGKSTLCHALAGTGAYVVTGGRVTLNGRDLLERKPEERAAAGLFLSFQYPVAIPGVAVMHFVRTAMNAQRRARGEDEIGAPQFLKMARDVAAKLDIDAQMLKRPLNVDFSGGEQKRLEIFQMMMLDPQCLILDETDSGLDIDALRCVAAAVESLRAPHRTMLVVTHYQRLLRYLRPDRVHVMMDGKLAASGDMALAERIERGGYGGIQNRL